MERTLFIAVLLIFLLAGNVQAGQTGYPDAGLDERPGGHIPLDLIFHDENGRSVLLKDLIDRPTALVLIYYDCSHICPQMLGGLAKSLSDLQLVPGKDYRVITISFDDTEKPEDARTQKRNYVKAINRPFPEDAWRFLTGDRDNIRRLSDAVGIRYKKAEHGFIHPEVLVFVSPEGKITRYMHVSRSPYGVAYPLTFSAFDLKNAFIEASAGKVFFSGKVMPLFCSLHEPANQKRFFDMLKVSGTMTVLALFLLFVYLKGRRKSAQ